MLRCPSRLQFADQHKSSRGLLILETERPKKACDTILGANADFISSRYGVLIQARMQKTKKDELTMNVTVRSMHEG